MSISDPDFPLYLPSLGAFVKMLINHGSSRNFCTNFATIQTGVFVLLKKFKLKRIQTYTALLITGVEFNVSSVV